MITQKYFLATPNVTYSLTQRQVKVMFKKLKAIMY